MRLVRAGVLVAAAAAVVAIVASFLPGYDVYDPNVDDCGFDWWGHAGACERREAYLHTERAGGAGSALVAALVALPGILVWRRPRARAAVAWALAILAGIFALAAYMILLDDSASGCDGTRREPLPASVVLSWSLFVTIVTPLVLAPIAVAAAWWRRRREVTTRRTGRSGA